MNASEVLSAAFRSAPRRRAEGSRKTLTGATMLLARCVRVTGASRPVAELRLPSGTVLRADVTVEQARELSKRLHDPIAVNGIAIWDAQGGAVREFSVASIAPFRAGPVDAAFRALWAASNNRWDGVDGKAYTDQLRER
jgi:hypothetical protein